MAEAPLANLPPRPPQERVEQARPVLDRFTELEQKRAQALKHLQQLFTEFQAVQLQQVTALSNVRRGLLHHIPLLTVFSLHRRASNYTSLMHCDVIISTVDLNSETRVLVFLACLC